MSDFDHSIARTGAQALMPEDVAREIVQGITEQSIVMALGRRLPDMPRNQRRMPVLSTLPVAYFVNGDIGIKKTTQMQWANKFINADEIAVLAPVPKYVLDDSDYDIWGEVKPRLQSAFAAKFDGAVLYGTDAPSDWPKSVYAQASAISGFAPSLASATDLYEAILGEDGNVAAMENCGFFPTAHVGCLNLRSKLRSVRDADGNLIFKTVSATGGNNVQGPTNYELDGAPLFFPRNGIMDASTALMFSGDWSQLVWAIRMDLEYTFLDQAVIQDETGAIVINLAQQNMIALRACMRIGWQLPNPINMIQTDQTLRLPFSILKP